MNRCNSLKKMFVRLKHEIIGGVRLQLPQCEDGPHNGVACLTSMSQDRCARTIEQLHSVFIVSIVLRRFS